MPEFGDRPLWLDWQNALRRMDGHSHLLRSSGRFPYCAVGRDINVAAVFAELMWTSIAPKGRVGCVVPSAVGTDDTTKEFSKAVTQQRALGSFYDFENRGVLFPEVHSSYKIALMTLTGTERPVLSGTDFAFFLHRPDELADEGRRFCVSVEDIAILSPNTGTCPVLRSRRDAELALAAYRRTPILAKEGVRGSNPWGMQTRPGHFHMSNDAELFLTVLEARVSPQDLLGLYEAKMMHQFDHRWLVSEDDCGEIGKRNPDAWSAPRYWIRREEVNARMHAGYRRWHLVVRDIARSTDERTMIATVLPDCGVGGTLMLLDGLNASSAASLAASLNSFAADYFARQRVAGTHLNPSVFRQVPVPTPQSFSTICTWDITCSIEKWLRSRVLELCYTAWDLLPFAQENGYQSPPFQWNQQRRFALRCELDAVLFHLYVPVGANGDWRSAEGEKAEDLARLKANFPTPRDAVAYIMDTFPIVKRKDEEKWDEYRTKRVILEIYDEITRAISVGAPYQTRLDPPPADPSCRHPKRKVGILAFGSLIHDPGWELESRIVMRIKTRTTFPVEYARFSAKRGGGPTLVPHENGSLVSAEILVLNDEVTVDQATNILWRGETGKIGSGETYPAGTSPNSVVVQQITDNACVSTVLYTDFLVEGKVANPRPEELAKYAIKSVGHAGEGEDGISYLIKAIGFGIETPLTTAYRDEILHLTNADTVEEALRKTKDAVLRSRSAVAHE